MGHPTTEHPELPPRPPLAALDDPRRVEAVRRLVSRGAVGTRLDELTSLSAEILGAAFAQVSLLTADEQIIASVHGLSLTPEQGRGPRAESLCSVTAASGAPLLVDDARSHPWVRDLQPVQTGAVGSYLGVPLRDPEGLVLGSLCVYDSTPRTWTEDHVHALTALGVRVSAELHRHGGSSGELASSERLRLAAEASDLGSYDYDLRTGELTWDPRMLALHGYTPQTFSGGIDAFDAVVHPADLVKVNEAMAHALGAVGDLVVTYRVLLADGALRWVNARGRVLPDMFGAPARIVGAAYDISAERGLRDELTRLLETMPAAFIRCDRSWTVTYVNAGAEKLCGATRHELVGVNLWQALPSVHGSSFETEYQNARSTGRPGVIEAYFAALDAHFEVQIWPDELGLSFFFHDVSERRRWQLALEQASERLTILSSAGAQLSASLQPDAVLSLLAGLIVPDLASWIVLAVGGEVAELLGIPGATAEDDQLHATHQVHARPEHQAVLNRVVSGLPLGLTAEWGVGRAVATGEHTSVTSVPDELLIARADDDEHLAQMRVLNTRPAFSVPLRSPGGILGAFTVGAPDDRELDELLLLDLAARAAVALDNALTFARQGREALSLQQALLPRTAAGVPDVQVATRYRPAATGALAGGDFFKTVRVDGRLVTVLGDVMGHGTASAARAGQLHSLVAGLALEGHLPGALLTRLAHGIDQTMDLQLATLLVCSYDPATRLLTAATAGHPAPLLAPSQGEPYYLDLDPGAPLGVAVTDYPEVSCTLEAGATLVLFSDGLVERRGESITVGLERLREAVRETRLPPESVAEHILGKLGMRQGGDDDLALLVLSHL